MVPAIPRLLPTWSHTCNKKKWNEENFSFWDFVPGNIRNLDGRKDTAFFESLTGERLRDYETEINHGEESLSPIYYDSTNQRLYNTLGRVSLFKDYRFLDRTGIAFLNLVEKIVYTSGHVFALLTLMPFWYSYGSFDLESRGIKKSLLIAGNHLLKIATSPLAIALTAINSIAYLFSQNYGSKLRIFFERVTGGYLIDTYAIAGSNLEAISRRFTKEEIATAEAAANRA